MPRIVRFIYKCSTELRYDTVASKSLRGKRGLKKQDLLGVGTPVTLLAGDWTSDPRPSRPQAVLKKLMERELSVMRTDFRPRIWSSFICISDPPIVRSLMEPGPRVCVTCLNFFTSTSARPEVERKLGSLSNPSYLLYLNLLFCLWLGIWKSSF